jgi:hypothetical protein
MANCGTHPPIQLIVRMLTVVRDYVSCEDAFVRVTGKWGRATQQCVSANINCNHLQATADSIQEKLRNQDTSPFADTFAADSHLLRLVPGGYKHRDMICS